MFLDEIGEIPPSAQIKLLRVLQTQSFERLGGEKTLTVQVHFLIDACFEKSEDYEDLLYWLKAVFDPSVVQESRGER